MKKGIFWAVYCDLLGFFSIFCHIHTLYQSQLLSQYMIIRYFFLMSFLSLCFLASNEIKQAEHIAATNPNTAATLLDVQSDNDLDSLVKEHSLVVRWVWL